MSSVFSWVDFEEKDRQRMLEIIQTFREPDTRDELGIGTIRDAFSDLLFPGTSTIQTRAKYLLFIPWICLRQEKSKTPSREAPTKVREDEVSLINALLKSTDTDGIIGGEAIALLQRMPSSVYWSGLARLGIRLYSGSVAGYFRYLDEFYRVQAELASRNKNEPSRGPLRTNWDPGLPYAPKGFPEQAELSLSADEAYYLADRIMNSCKKSLLAYLIREGHRASCPYIWKHPHLGSFPEEHKKQVMHARNFALSINGAALMYNYMLAEAKGVEELVEKYRTDLQAWEKEMESICFDAWDHDSFWELVNTFERVPHRTCKFVRAWLDLVGDASSRRSILESQQALELISHRERQLKGNRARLCNNRQLELWSGAAGTGMLTYRWAVAQTIINDIVAGMGGNNA